MWLQRTLYIAYATEIVRWHVFLNTAVAFEQTPVATVTALFLLLLLGFLLDQFIVDLFQAIIY